MTDLRYLDDLDRAEEDLIDDYARGDLDRQENEKFESLFLNDAERREKIVFAQILNRRLSSMTRSERQPHFSPSFWRPAAMGLAAAVVLLALATAFLYWKTIQVRQQLTKFELEQAAFEKNNKLMSDRLDHEQARRQSVERELAALRTEGHPVTSDVLALALNTGWTRGAEGVATATLSSATKRLRLDLAISHDLPRYGSYQAQVQTVEGKAIWGKDRLKMVHQDGKQIISANVPASAIAPGDYLVALNGVDPDGKLNEVATYYFRVARKGTP